MQPIIPFEAAEKRLVIQFDQKINLLTYPSHFWQQQLSFCSASILSTVRNKQVHAYLLSESSLLVFKHRIVLITCGLCPLINTALALIEHFTPSAIHELSFQRQPEKNPTLQLSQFNQDSKKLSELFPSIEILANSAHYINNSVTPSPMTFNWLLTPLPKPWQNQLLKSGLTKTRVRQLLALELLNPEYEVDDWLFDPVGYSANGITRHPDGEDYFCLHLSPEPSCSTLSIECSNATTLKLMQKHLKHFTELNTHTA